MADELDLPETEEERDILEMRDKYAALFGNDMGREVLRDILLTCHFGATLDPDNKAQIAEYNVGIVIAAKAGFLERLQAVLGLRAAPA